MWPQITSSSRMGWFMSTILLLAIAAIATAAENDGNTTASTTTVSTTLDLSENNPDLMKQIEEDVKLEINKPKTALKPGQFINKLANNIGKEVKKILPKTDLKGQNKDFGKRAFSFFDMILKSMGINMDSWSHRRNSTTIKPSDTTVAPDQQQAVQQGQKDTSATKINDNDSGSEEDPFFSFISGLNDK
ncbi:hypothetical protein B566_EDAN007740 [Ephemera danica]|nr:hypothetical protein B566_EDAN007740 [Ephemera danica]